MTWRAMTSMSCSGLSTWYEDTRGVTEEEEEEEEEEEDEEEE